MDILRKDLILHGALGFYFWSAKIAEFLGVRGSLSGLEGLSQFLLEHLTYSWLFLKEVLSNYCWWKKSGLSSWSKEV